MWGFAGAPLPPQGTPTPMESSTLSPGMRSSWISHRGEVSINTLRHSCDRINRINDVIDGSLSLWGIDICHACVADVNRRIEASLKESMARRRAYKLSASAHSPTCSFHGATLDDMQVSLSRLVGELAVLSAQEQDAEQRRSDILNVRDSSRRRTAALNAEMQRVEADHRGNVDSARGLLDRLDSADRELAYWRASCRGSGGSGGSAVTSLAPLFDHIHIVDDYGVINGSRLSYLPKPRCRLDWAELDASWALLASCLVSMRNAEQLPEEIDFRVLHSRVLDPLCPGVRLRVHALKGRVALILTEGESGSGSGSERGSGGVGGSGDGSGSGASMHSHGRRSPEFPDSSTQNTLYLEGRAGRDGAGGGAAAEYTSAVLVLAAALAATLIEIRNKRHSQSSQSRGDSPHRCPGCEGGCGRGCCLVGRVRDVACALVVGAPVFSRELDPPPDPEEADSFGGASYFRSWVDGFVPPLDPVDTADTVDAVGRVSPVESESETYVFPRDGMDSDRGNPHGGERTGSRPQSHEPPLTSTPEWGAVFEQMQQYHLARDIHGSPLLSYLTLSGVSQEQVLEELVCDMLRTLSRATTVTVR